MSKHQSVGHVARKMGLKPSAVRFYERQGLVASERQANGYRVYSRDAIDALHFVVRAKALGFSLEQIREVLALRRGGSHPCGCVKELVERNLQDINRKMSALAQLKRELQALARRPAPRAVTRGICSLIESQP
jgi:DNA-binding transcriptional MerR regulator